MKARLSCPVVVALLCAATSAHAELQPSVADAGVATADTPIAVTTRVDPREVKLGEPFRYEVVLSHPAARRYDLQGVSPGGPVEILGHSRQRLDQGSTATTTFQVRAALFELGPHPLPDLTFEVSEGGRLGHFTLHGPAVTGLSTLPEDAAQSGAALEDIKPPEAIWMRSYRLLGFLGLGLLGAALLFLLVRQLRRRAQRPAPAAPPLPLEVRTRSALEALAQEGLPEKGRAREFYYRLSEILRGYLGERFGVDALECTSTELIARLSEVHAQRLVLPELSHFLDASDLVKFARGAASVQVCADAFQYAQRLVEQTTPGPNTPHAPGPHISAA
jgi:hypothetical protein